MSDYFAISFASSSTISSPSSIKSCRSKRRMSSFTLDPDLIALSTLTTSVDLGRKCLQDRIDRMPSMADQHTPEDWEHWNELLESDAQCTPKILEQVKRDEKELKDVQDRLRKRGLNHHVRKLSVGRRCLSRLPSCDGLIQPARQ